MWTTAVAAPAAANLKVWTVLRDSSAATIDEAEPEPEPA